MLEFWQSRTERHLLKKASSRNRVYLMARDPKNSGYILGGAPQPAIVTATGHGN